MATFWVKRKNHRLNLHLGIKDRSPRGKSFAANISQSESAEANSCLMCKKEHKLQDSTVFVSKSISERRDFVMEKRLCFACLKGNHNARKLMLMAVPLVLFVRENILRYCT